MAKSGSATALTRPPPRQSPNKLLAALSALDYQRILPNLTTVPLKFKQVLHKHRERISAVYFPGGGVCSITNVMDDGRMVEVATIGREGFVGMTAFTGDGRAMGDAFVQVPDGEGQSMSIDAFRREVDRRGAFYDLIARYSQAHLALVMQSIACNALHLVEERCARWLLMTHDRVGRDDFQLTHEFLSMMLGVRRPTVSLVLGAFHKAGIIDNGSKKIRVLERQRLEDASCECYRVVTDAFARLLPDAPMKDADEPFARPMTQK